MKSKTRLDSAVFQLTPTRTRYTLVINAKGETEKISSGLLGPFLAHLKAAQDQVSRGCYSILLQPKPVSDAAWFTKGTVDRFVRFVNSPEVLERVNMTESEILQIEQAIAIQDSDALGSCVVESQKKKAENYRERPLKIIEGSLPLLNVDVENTILFCKLGSGFAGRENSKVQFLRVLETRKTMLQKEQGMAFARAIAAGFEIDCMVHLVSFAECFGAARLMEACLGFMVLWKGKHEKDQWFENEVPEAMPSQSEVFPLNNQSKKHNELKEVCTDSDGKYGIQANGRASDAVIGIMNFHHDRDKSPGHQQRVYHQNHVGNGPFLQQTYSQMGDPRLKNPKSMAIKIPRKKNSGKNTEEKTREANVSFMSPQDALELERKNSLGQEQWRKPGRTARKKSDVVIHNINYISSKKMKSRPHDGPQSSSDTGNEKEDDEVQDNDSIYKQKISVVSAESKECRTGSTSAEETVFGYEVDSGNWQVFQNILLQHDKDIHATDQGMFTQETEVQVKRRKNRIGADPIISHGRDSYEVTDGRRNHSHRSDGMKICLLNASCDELISSEAELGLKSNDCLVGGHFTGRGEYKKQVDGHTSNRFTGSEALASHKNLYDNSLYNASDESYILPLRLSIQDQTKASATVNMDAEIVSGLQKKENGSSRVKGQLIYEPDDLSINPMFETIRESIGYDPAVDSESQVCAKRDVTVQKETKPSVTGVKETSYNWDKDELRVLHPNAVVRKNSRTPKIIPTEVEARAEKIRSLKSDLQKTKKAKEEEELKRLETLKRERQKRISERSSSGPALLMLSTQFRPQLKPKLSQTSDKASHIHASKPGQLPSLQRFPNRPASLGSSGTQKITRPSNSNKASPSQSSLASQMRPQLQAKLSPVSYKGSKFSDSEPGPSSPLQRLHRQAASLRSNASQKITRPSDSNSGKHDTSIKPLQSVSSLSELKKGNSFMIPEIQSASRIRKLSDPKISNIGLVASTKLGITASSELKVSATGVLRLSQPGTSNRHHNSSIKLQSSFPLTNIKEASWPRAQKIATTVSKDKSKVAVRPEMTNRMLKFPADRVQNIAKEFKLKPNGKPSVTLEATEVQQSSKENSHNGKGEDDKQVIETTVVLENEMPQVSPIQVCGARINIRNESCNEHEIGANPGLIAKYAAIKAPAPSVSPKVAEGPNKCCSDKEVYSPKVPLDYFDNEHQYSSIDVSPKACQTPCAQVSSLEGPCTTNLEDVTTPPNSSQMARRSLVTAKAHASDLPDSSSLEKTPGSIFKNRVKLSSKGIRRILRFGRRATKHVESDSRLMNKDSLVDNCVASTASSSKGKKLEKRGFRNPAMSHALYIV